MSEKQTSEILAFVFGVNFLAALLLFVLLFQTRRRRNLK